MLENSIEIIKIRNIQDNLLNKSIVYFCFIAFIAAGASLLRIVQSGLQFAHVVHIILLVSLVILTLFRKKLPYPIRFRTLITILMTIGTVGIYSYGLLAGGMFAFISATILSLALSKKMTSYGILGLSIAITGLFMYLYSSGSLILNIDETGYTTKITSWINLIFSFILFVGPIVIITSGYLSSLSSQIQISEELIQEKESRNVYLDKKVKERNAQLEQLLEDKNRILGIVSHDLKNKITGVQGVLDLLTIDECVISAVEANELMQKASLSCKYAMELLLELAHYSKASSISHELKLEKINICEFIKSTVDCNMATAIEKSIELSITSTDNEIFCAISKPYFSRVIDNLLSNALKFTHKNGSVEVRISSENEKVEIKIQDSGIGIPDSIKNDLFKPFTSAGRKGTEKEETFGLGLSISKKIVEDHSGKIWFESKVGEGTTFFINLPECVLIAA